MKRLLTLLSLFVVACTLTAQAADPLRIFIRAGVKTHGPNAHEHERFLNDWKKLLADRGMKTDGALDWPTAAQLAQTDVVVCYAEEAGNANPEQRAAVEAFVKRGGGIVVIHSAAVAKDHDWWKSIIGGSWVFGTTKWKEGPMDLYYTENERIDDGHPITKGASNFHVDDEIYYDMDISPDVRVLATSYTPNVPAGKKPVEGNKPNIYDIQPQMWAYEKDNYRAFVSIPGHLYSTFELPHYRAILLRGIAWAGKRANVDEYCNKAELDSLRYPEGGPSTPAKELAQLEIHPDFKLTLVAAEPLINKPMNFDWDPAGRLWVAETPEYPNGKRGMRPDYRGKEWKDHGGLDPAPGEQDRPGRDKISMLTDTDGDGVMDKKEIFYEGLNLVTGLVFYKDGVIVTQAPDILWLRDTNGDGKADKVETLYHGLGTGDTHAVINNPRWGWDGWIYATHGYSASANVVNVKGEKQGNIGSGVVRFRPDGMAIEQYSSKGGNTWGLEVTGDNRVMWTQPTSGTILQDTVLPEYALARGKVGNTASFKTVIGSPKSWPLLTWDQMAYVQIDLVGSFTAAAGCVIYDGGSWPAEYNGDYFTTEPTINIVHHERITPEASSYTGKKLPGRENTEFIRSKDMWFRPIEVRVGPDGAVYVGDFYNQAVIHNDTRGPDHNRVNAAVRPDRDHYFGRIWRLDHKDAKKIAVPDLSKADVATLAKALEHPNRAVRMNASRLLADLNPNPGDKPVPGSPVWQQQFGIVDMTKLAGDVSKSADARIAALWTLNAKNSSDPALLARVLQDASPEIRRNAALVIENYSSMDWSGKGPDKDATAKMNAALGALVSDPDAHVRVAALRALAARELSDDGAKAVIAAWSKFDDDFQKSAAIGAASRNSAAAIAAALASPDATALAPLVVQLAVGVAEKNDAAAAAKLVVSLAAAPSAADGLKRSILDTLAKSLKDAPAMTPELSAALSKLLAGGASGSVLPLAAKWDKAGALKGEVMKMTSNMIEIMNDKKASEDARFAAITSLLGIRSADVNMVYIVSDLLGTNNSPALQRRIITALGEGSEPEIGKKLTTVFAKLPPEAQPAAFEVLLKRADWSLALLDAMKAKTVDVSVFGPANLARLRTHPDKNVSKAGNAVLDELMGPALKAKNEALAKLTPIVEQPGNAENGKALFTAACATCHKLGDLGADIAPVLTGMGAHGPAELLIHIVDPNREVDPSFVAWNIETKDGNLHAGIVARENPTSLLMKSLAGQEEIKVADIKTRVNTGRSLMPEGLEGLGGEALRDILTFICGADALKFRILDLTKAFTTTTAHGIYSTQNDVPENFHFAKTGLITLGGIPFTLVAPEKSANGNNVVQLKGGANGSYAKTQMPKSVEIPGGGFKANRLHFLGNVAGWGFPYGSDKSVVLKATVHFVGGASEILEFRNGVEFADYINRSEVPGSKFAEGVTKNAQVRWCSKQLKNTAPIEKIVLESADNDVAPSTFGITAELADANAAPLSATPSGVTATTAAVAAPAEDSGFKPQFTDPVPQPPAKANGPRVLLVGGGSSHDFVKFFGATDKATLTPVVGWVDFTQNLNGIAPILKDIDVLVLSANQPISSETKKALIDFANAGKGIIALHPGTWYAWEGFPQWNKEIVGGGTRGHDALGPYTVKVTNAASPLAKGVTQSFEITDELYNYTADPNATPIEVIAEATSPKSGKAFPQVFVVKHPKAKIVGLTLGHDARAHDLPEYQALLKNAVLWAAGK